MVRAPKDESKLSAGERILATATSLFARSGYNGISTREIAAAANVNEVTIFRHFPRKHDLCVSVLKSCFQNVQLRGDLLGDIADAPDGVSALARTFDMIVKSLSDKPEILRLLLYSSLELSAEFDSLARRYLRELIDVTAHYLDPWINNGQLAGKDSKALVLTLIAIGVSYGPLHQLFLQEGIDPDKMFQVYATFCSASHGHSSSHRETATPGECSLPAL